MKLSSSIARLGFAASCSGVLALGCSDAPSEGGAGGSGGGSAGVSAGGGAGTSAGGAATGASSGTGSISGSPSSGGSSVGAGGGGAASGGSSGAAGGGASNGGAAAGMGGAMAGGAGGSGGGGVTMSKGCGATSWPMSKNNVTIMVDGESRTYNLKVPDNYDTNKPYRLIFAFHWLNGTAQNVTSGQYYGLLPLSQNSTIFVAPQGIDNGWRDSGRTQTKGGKDVAFAQALLEEMKNTLCVDTTRVFSEGFSMGGSMSYALACALGDTLRGVAVHSGGPMSGCVQHDKPVAYFMTHGTNDSVCTYPEYGVPQVEDFAKLNGCQTAQLPTPTSSAGACIDYPGCSAGHPTRGCIFVGDHVYNPGGANSWVPAETWKFISQF